MTNHERPVRGAVAQILNSRELVINRGKEHGVALSMVFDVLAPEGEDILDPETGDVLGSVDRTKVVVKVVQVEPKLAVARTFKSHRRNIGGRGMGGSGFDNLFKPPKYVVEYETLKTSETTWEDLPEEESYVKIGDPVREHIQTSDDAE